MLHPIHNVLSQQSMVDLLSALENEVAERRVKMQHKNDLTLFDYTEETVFSRQWNEYNICCRGLVLGSSRVIALPFPKFFNLGENNTTVSQRELTQSTFYTKYDGSLIIMYWYNNRWNFNTRGSFNSQQAIDAETWFYSNISAEEISTLNTDLTYCLEWVSPNNRIVLNYTNSGLVLLGAFNIYSYEDLVLEDIPWNISLIRKAVTQSVLYEDGSLESYIKTHKDVEGVVIRTPSKRVKVKTEWYVNLHKIISDFSAKRVFNIFEEAMIQAPLGNINVAMDYKQTLPEEFWDEFDGYLNKFMLEYVSRTIEAYLLIETHRERTDKEIGLDLNLIQPQKSLIFTAKKRSINDVIKLILKQMRGYYGY